MTATSVGLPIRRRILPVLDVDCVVKESYDYMETVAVKVIATVGGALECFEAGVEEGGLEGSGPGKSAEKRLNALHNKLLEAEALMAEGDTAAAIDELQSLRALCDGEPRPSDHATGEAAAELADLLQVLIDGLSTP